MSTEKVAYTTTCIQLSINHTITAFGNSAYKVITLQHIQVFVTLQGHTKVKVKTKVACTTIFLQLAIDTMISLQLQKVPEKQSLQNYIWCDHLYFSKGSHGSGSFNRGGTSPSKWFLTLWKAPAGRKYKYSSVVWLPWLVGEDQGCSLDGISTHLILRTTVNEAQLYMSMCHSLDHIPRPDSTLSFPQKVAEYIYYPDCKSGGYCSNRLHVLPNIQSMIQSECSFKSPITSTSSRQLTAEQHALIASLTPMCTEPL